MLRAQHSGRSYWWIFSKATALTTLAIVAAAIPAVAAPDDAARFGKLSGLVVDPSGIPQMGASIAVSGEGPQNATLQLLSNDRGTFAASRILPGMYSVRVTLAGFLPAVERHVRVEPNITTLLKIELGSLFSSIDQLRRKPGQATESDDWAWILRTSAASRAVLRLADGEVVEAGAATRAESAQNRKPHARLELTSGAKRRGSVSNLADAPASAFSFEQNVGRGKLMLAGQASYERSAAAGFATTWMPSGMAGVGPEASLAMRQSKLGPGGLTFRGVRAEHNNRLAVSDKLELGYGAEYILVSLGRSTSSVRPGAELTYHVSPEWQTSFIMTSRPWSHAHGETSALISVLQELDAFPTVLMRDGRPVLEGGWHEEWSVQRKLGDKITVQASLFRDRSRHTALFGRGSLTSDEVLQDFFSNAFTYDGGGLSTPGSRVAYSQKLSDDTEIVVLYAWAGALTAEDVAEALSLRDALGTEQRHSVAARVSTRVPRSGTRLSASYKWLNAPVVSRQDPYGETAYQMDPHLNFSVRQPLPALFFSGARFEALADFRNLLAQGYVPVSTQDGQVLLIPAFRSFRGGLSFQF